MITIEQEAVVTPEHQLTISVPPTVSPGRRRVVVVLEEAAEAEMPGGGFEDFPVFHDMTLKTNDLSRSVIYGDDGR